MLVFLLSATLVQAEPLQAEPTYASAGLREAVARAAERNREVPAGLASYRARVESEAAFIIHGVDRRELTGQIEQIASRLHWRRGGDYAQHVIGHRIRAAGPNPSVISYMQRGWTMPVLYGERLGVFGVDIDDADEPREPTYRVVHPFSRERERLYRFDGGDTVAVLRLPERDVHVMRIRVTPHRSPDPDDDRVLAFHGDIDVDAERYEIVRMRGRLVVFRPAPGIGARLLGLAARGVAYVDLENAEYEGRYWLPYRQRIELQATTALTDSRAVIRIVSQFREHHVRSDASEDVADAADDTATARADRPSFELTFAPADTLTGYDAWVRGAGEATAGLSARDFDDVAPRALRPGGPPHVRPGARQLMDVLRYNRVEGLYTGMGGVLAFRDAAPGLELRGAGGWAWTEQAPRGYLELLLRRDGWELGGHAARDLAQTNDFVPPLEEGLGILMLLGAGDDCAPSSCTTSGGSTRRSASARSCSPSSEACSASALRARSTAGRTGSSSGASAACCDRTAVACGFDLLGPRRRGPGAAARAPRPGSLRHARRVTCQSRQRRPHRGDAAKPA